MIKRRIFIGVVAFFILIQFFRIDKKNPPVEVKKDFIEISNPPLQVAKIIKASCYDCHSHETKYPWYSDVAPISWWLKDHIDEARSELNFSQWSEYNPKKQDHKLDECIEEVEEGEMPLDSYTWIHQDAVLSADQIEVLLKWLESQRTYLSE